MITVSANQKVFARKLPIDFRNGIDGTVAKCRELLQFKETHLSGSFFLFINRSKTQVRAYYFDGHGEYMITKRAVKGKFKWWDIQPSNIHPLELMSIFSGNGPLGNLPAQWKKIN